MKKILITLTALVALSTSSCAPKSSESKPSVIVPPTSIPGASVNSGSIGAIAPSIKGTYRLTDHACYNSSGMFFVQLVPVENETLAISDTTWVDTFEMRDGCVLAFNFDIRGVSPSQITVSNLRVVTTYNGEIDSQGNCAQYRPAPASPGQSWTYNWVVEPSNGFARLTSPTGNCHADEWDADEFSRI